MSPMSPIPWPEIKALAFDFNGVVVDDEILHCKAIAAAARPLGVELTVKEYWDRYLAYSDREALRALLADATARGVKLPPYDFEKLLEVKVKHYLDLVGAHPPFFEGVCEMIRRLSVRFTLAVVSGARRQEIEYALGIGGIRDLFPVIVAEEDVTESKPSPEPYIKAAKLLGIEPRHLVAIEDSLGGINSARFAGYSVVAVEHSYPAEKLGHAHIVIHTVKDLERLIS